MKHNANRAGSGDVESGYHRAHRLRESLTTDDRARRAWRPNQT